MLSILVGVIPNLALKYWNIDKVGLKDKEPDAGNCRVTVTLAENKIRGRIILGGKLHFWHFAY